MRRKIAFSLSVMAVLIPILVSVVSAAVSGARTAVDFMTNFMDIKNLICMCILQTLFSAASLVLLIKERENNICKIVMVINGVQFLSGLFCGLSSVMFLRLMA